MADPLDRFVTAQEAVYPSVLGELRRGRKSGHWIWFVFPQLRGLGRSEMSERYGVASIDEARAYLAHPILGARLRACAEVLLSLEERSAEQVFGPVDAMKVRSSMTLFHRAAPDEPAFAQVLERLYAGRADPLTDARLDQAR